MTILGISAGFHDGAATLIDRHGEILFAGHSERYSKVKFDPGLSWDMLEEIWHHDITDIAYYERPMWHNLQRLGSGQRPLGPWTLKGTLRQELNGHYERISAQRYHQFPHHLSHAAAAFQTSPFDQAAVVVIDAIGELDTVSIYRAWYDINGQAKYKRMWHRRYPHSLGLFYSAITQRVGLRPMDEEYITMGMAAYGDSSRAEEMARVLVSDAWNVRFRDNMHTGLDASLFRDWSPEDLAACAQAVTEHLIRYIMLRARIDTGETHLVYGGGVALNCVANRTLGDYFNDMWILPNPGDAGSSLGAAALAHGGRVHWRNAFLGHCIRGDYPVHDCLQHLLARGIVGVASGRAEFGPRALGNRSLLADPRGSNIRDRVNDIKQRQRFRPFAPAILAEYRYDYFEMPRGWINSDYMQVIAKCRDPDAFPAICHVDGTSRVQTVQKDGSGLRQLLEAWHAETGCPMLLNTSLNIRGEPMVNDRADADRFEQLYGVKVCS